MGQDGNKTSTVQIQQKHPDSSGADEADKQETDTCCPTARAAELKERWKKYMFLMSIDSDLNWEEYTESCHIY